MSGRYSEEVEALREYFKERLPNLGTFAMTRCDYEGGVDYLVEPQKSLTNEAMTEWLANRRYELSYNQMCQAFFAAASELQLLTIEQHRQLRER